MTERGGGGAGLVGTGKQRPNFLNYCYYGCIIGATLYASRGRPQSGLLLLLLIINVPIFTDSIHAEKSSLSLPRDFPV